MRSLRIGTGRGSPGYPRPVSRPLPLLYPLDQDALEYSAFLLELQHAVDLLTEGGVVAERMALTITDGLAERLLYQHAQRCFSAADAKVGILIDPFPAERRARILGDFRKRVQLALTDEELFVFISPLLDEPDADIFRLAHDYRGPSYHRGEHNPALAGPLGRLYVEAVGRAFVRAMEHAFSTFDAESVRELDRYREEGGPLSPKHGSAPLVEAITSPGAVDRGGLASQLRLDLESRLGAVEGAIEGLRCDLDEERLAELISAAQHWAEHRGDEELHALARERQILENEAERQEAVGEELAREILANELAQHERMQELKETTTILVDLGSPSAIRRRATGFSAKRSLAALLHAYREVDDLLTELESAVEWVHYSWERSVEQAVDEVRGK
jgi:hypothetical protein